MRWSLAAIVLLVMAWAMQAGLVVYAAAAMALVAVAGHWLAAEGLNRIEAGRRVSANEINVCETVEVRVDVENTGRRSIVWLLLEDLLPESALTQRPARVKLHGRRLRVRSLLAGKVARVDYKITFQQRGVYPIGPMVVESGDLFGFSRKWRALAPPAIVTVLPRVVPLNGYDIASRRPIGDVRLTHRLYEDPTRIAGVRPYEPGDPLNRVHWRATARTGRLHSKVYEPSTLAGATLLLDMHEGGYPQRGEPYRSELAATTAASLAHAILLLQQQVGLWSNGGDMAAHCADATLDRLLASRVEVNAEEREAFNRARAKAAETAPSLRVLGVPTRRGMDQLIQIRRILARLEPSDHSFAQFIAEITPRLPRDATALALLPHVTSETAIALGTLRRQGFAVAAILIIPGEDGIETSLGRLAAEGIRDVRVLQNEAQLPDLCSAQIIPAAMKLLG